jgi:hypothetical protein
MKRFLAVVGACVLAAASPFGFVAAQTDTPVNADGTHVVADDDGAPIASGAGQDIVYGDINTGGGGGEVLGDPSAVYAPARPDHPGPNGGMIVMPGAGDGLIGGVPVMPILRPTAPDNTAMTTTALDNTAGSTSENVPLETTTDTTTTSEAAPAPAEGEATGTGFCASYGTWYDAQLAYENLGATGADPALVQEVDPDYDGIACEAMMA